MSGAQGDGDVTVQQAAHRVTLLATALKLTSIYRPQHPRVLQAVETLLAAVRERAGGGPFVLHLRESVCHGDGVAVPSDTVPIRWLADRLREGCLRGVEIERSATADDVIAFAAWLQQARRQGAATSPPLEGRLRAVPMVFRGHHSESGGGGGAGAEAAVAAAVAAPRTESALAEVRMSAECRERLLRIEGIAAAISPNQQSEVDLVAVIGSLLPGDVAGNPELVAEIVGRVLESLECDLRAVQVSGRRFAGGQLLQRAIDVARRYFPCAPTERPVPARLPSGRPEDAAITADLLKFLDEYDDLPLDDRPLADMLFGAVGTRLDHEFLSILLFGFARGHDHPAAVERLRQALRLHARDLPDLLDAYLRPDGRVPAARRLRLVQMLVETGHRTIVRDRGYVDHELVVKGFPDSLQLVVAVHDDGPVATRLLGESLAMLGQSAIGSAASLTVHSGALAQPAVWRLLLAVGGEAAHQIVLAAAAAHPVEMRAELVPWLRQQAVPGPEALVLRLHANPQSLPAAWVLGVYAAVVKRRPDDAVRAATGAMLREAVDAADRLAPADRLAAIDQLAAVPGVDSERMLVRLAQQGRFLKWSPQARAVRARAAAALARFRRGEAR